MTTEILFDDICLETFNNSSPTSKTMRRIATALDMNRLVLENNLTIIDQKNQTTAITGLYPFKPHQRTGDPTQYTLNKDQELKLRTGITIRRLD